MDKTTWSGYIEKSFPKLEKDIESDVLVIGGGLCGILCAYHLEKNGKNVVVVEANKICDKKSLKTTATITAIEDVMYKDLMKNLGFEKAKAYLEANLFALNEYRNLAMEFDFDFEECSSYKYSTHDKREILDEIEAIKSLGYHCDLVDDISFPVKFEAALEFKNQGQMNPLKLVNILIKDLKIYEDTRVIKIKGNNVFTEKNRIKTKNILVCTGFPFLRFKGLYFMKMHQEKSHVVDVFDEYNTKGNGVGTLNSDLYFRNYKDSVLIGASDAKTGDCCDAFDKINKLIVDKYKVTKINHRWINIDAMTLDGLPYIGTISGFEENVFVATGFNMWGMTKSMLAAHIINDLIDGKNNRFACLFSPQRKLAYRPLFKNIGSAVKGMVSFETKRCKHLGCALKYNSIDQTYECPCHGSKYDKDGKIIEGPTQKNLNLERK